MGLAHPKADSAKINPFYILAETRNWGFNEKRESLEGESWKESVSTIKSWERVWSLSGLFCRLILILSVSVTPATGNEAIA